MKCDNCIHGEMCANRNKMVQIDEHTWDEFELTDNVEDLCRHFKNKADVEEVVRCEKCKDFEPHGNGKAGICRNRNHKPCLRHDTAFCSYGERKTVTDTNVGGK